jgi:diaminohydroxyphosphoribosylaminopyrimidine deaminase/5-amino-6-(5-phosphoribosylamino)uracil reductase
MVNDDERHMRRAIQLAAGVRTTTAPNPWVGSVIEPGGFEGATRPPGGPHAEIVALDHAGDAARGATLYATLEPCAHVGRTPPCVDRIINAGVARVVVGIEDPDERVRGAGIRALRAAGVTVDLGVCADEVQAQLSPYLKHRSTGRPWVVLKLAATLDGRTAAPDGSSRWITGPAARADAHRLRAESDAVIVGAGTVRVDDPSLTVRDGAERKPASVAERSRAPVADRNSGVDPLRVVLGKAPDGAKVHPALELTGDLGEILDDLGRRGVLQAMVEGGATVAGEFHRAGLVDRYVLYLAPALFGGDDARPVFAGPGAPTIADVWRGRIVSVQRLGDDLRVECSPA